MVQFYLRYNLAKKAPVGIFENQMVQENCVDIPFYSYKSIPAETAFVFINIYYSEKQIEITDLLPVDDLNEKVFRVVTQNSNSFDAYSSVALEELIEQLNQGTARTNNGVQPTVEYAFNGERYQWSVIPW